MQIQIVDRNAAFPGRQPNLWAYYRVKGRKVGEPLPDTARSERAIENWKAELRRKVNNGTWAHPSQRQPKEQFSVWAAEFVRTRSGPDRSVFRTHLLPAYGDLLMRDLSRFVVVKERWQRILASSLAPRSIHQVYRVLVAIMTQAAKEDLMTMPPRLSVRAGELPERIDKSDWRESAFFEAREVAAIARGDFDSLYKVIFLTDFLTGARRGEPLPCRVRDYQDRKPLKCLLINAFKAAHGARRQVPVHPDLAAWLDWWLEHEWPRLYGRKPEADDLLFPSPCTNRSPGGRQLSGNQVYKYWKRNALPKVGLRHRRVHDTRRTLVSMLHYFDADPILSRMITHNSCEDPVIGGYRHTDWKKLCAEMVKIEWDLPRPMTRELDNVVPLRARNT